jgi:hypothetical protein
MSKAPQHINPRAEAGPTAGAMGFMGVGGVQGRRSGAELSPEGLARDVMRQGQQGQQTAEKVRECVANAQLVTSSVNMCKACGI